MQKSYAHPHAGHLLLRLHGRNDADVTWIGFNLATTYSVVAATSYIIPGPDMAVILPRALRGWRKGAAAALGVQGGTAVHCLLAVLGLSALIATRPSLLLLIQIAGGAYLVWLGLTDLKATTRSEQTPPRLSHAPPGRSSWSQDFLAGLGANVINPKAILFFVAILPQFVPHGASTTSVVIQLAALDIAIGSLVWTALIALSHFAAPRVLTATTQKLSATVMASILVVLGCVFITRSVTQLL